VINIFGRIRISLVLSDYGTIRTDHDWRFQI